MASKRERETNNGIEEEGLDFGTKRQRKDEESSASPPPVSIANPLSGLANNYADIVEEEDYDRRERVTTSERRYDGTQKNGHGYQEDDDSDEDEAREQLYGGRSSRQVEVRKDCPYLDTINRQVLDLDFEKLGSVSLPNLNVCACLVCGKYYQGRGKRSHAYTHSLEAGHHVYIILRTEKVYCLPDGSEINDPSLDDILHVLNPRFTPKDVELIDKNKQWSRALDGSSYLPAMVGLNTIKDTDFVNVTIQSLMRVTPFRDIFLIPENYQHCISPLVH